jgi:hypothetical protein
MALIKSSEKTYMLENGCISEYYLGGNVKFLEESWKNQGLGLALSEKIYIQNVIAMFEDIFWQEFKPIMVTMSEGKRIPT